MYAVALEIPISEVIFTVTCDKIEPLFFQDYSANVFDGINLH